MVKSTQEYAPTISERINVDNSSHHESASFFQSMQDIPF